jgi:glycosyltransferase involved in cell wall biosynthesis
LRILYLNPSGQLGGAELSLLDLIASIRAAEPDWILQLIASDDGPLVAKARSLGVESKVLPFPHGLASIGEASVSIDLAARGPVLMARSLCKVFPAFVTYVRRLDAAIKSLSPDLIHTNGFKMHILGAWANSMQVPLVWNIRDFVSSRKVMSRLLRMHRRWCTAVIANSQSVATDMRAVCGDQPDVCDVHNAIDLEYFSPNGNHLDLDRLSNLKGSANGVVRIGMVGTMARWKGQEIFLEAISKLPKNLPFRGYVIGGPIYVTDGSQYSIEELRALAMRTGIADRVGFTGYACEPADAIRALDVLVHASTEPEPFGRVIAEGMACGRAVIASAGGGAAEIISEGVDGLCHPPGDAAALARCIELLISNSCLRESLAKAGRSTAERRFDRAQLAGKFVPIYSSVALQAH